MEPDDLTQAIEAAFTGEAFQKAVSNALDHR